MEPLELVCEKNEVSTLSLDFLRCGGFAPDSSAFAVSAVFTFSSFTGCPRDSVKSPRAVTAESKLVTDLDDSDERREGLLPLEERGDLLDGMMGR